MAKIRILRLLEYIYDDVELMEKDMDHWQIGQNNTYKPNSGITIRSATLPVETFIPVEQIQMSQTAVIMDQTIEDD